VRLLLLAVFSVALVQAGCGFEVSRRSAEGDVPVESRPAVVADPREPSETRLADATPDAGGSPETQADNAADGPVPYRQPGEAAADVIRTRIAWREAHAPDTRPAAATAPPVIAREIHRDSIASSPDLGVMWVREAAGGYKFEDALTYCEVLVTAGYDDWRLPGIDELQGLLYAETDIGWGNEVRVFWSSTPHDPRGVQTIVLPDITRSHQMVGVAFAVCVRNVAPDGGS